MKSYVQILSIVVALALSLAGNCVFAFPGSEKTKGNDSSPGTEFKLGETPASVVPQTLPALEALPKAEVETISGTVVETMNSGGYTYALLENKGKKTWVAMPETQVLVGMELGFSGGSEMVNFPSKALKRTFDSIMFCNAPIRKSGEGKMAGKQSPGSEGALPVVTEKIEVGKAAAKNSYTVAEIYMNKSKLDNRQIVVKGKVVKFSAGIMDKNWVHLQDGSGDVKLKTNNLVVTTQDTLSVGDIVIVTGTLRKDKDFGSGYKYDVILEDATIKQ
jgi:hypothetical protein